MAIHYILRDNKATSDPNDQRAAVAPTGTMDEAAFIDRFVQENPGFTRAQVAAFFQAFPTTLANVILEGQFVNLRFLSATSSIRGKFDNAADVFTAPRNSFNFGLEAGPMLQDRIQGEGEPQKDVAPLPEPVLTQFKNVVTGELNSTAKSAGLAEIKGDDLKHNQAAADEGIFFVPGTGAAAKVTISAANYPKTQTFTCPTLTAQTYTVEIRRRFAPTGPLRTGTLPVQITGVP